MATRTHLQPDPFAHDGSSEEFFAAGDVPTAVEKIELEVTEDDTEIARRSAPEVVLRRRRYRRLVARVVSAGSVVALAALARTALAPANASSLRPAAVALAPHPARVLEPAAEDTPTKAEEPAKAEPAGGTQTQAPDVAKVAVTEPSVPAPEAKVARRAAKRDDDFSDLDVKIDVPKIDISSLDLSVQ